MKIVKIYANKQQKDTGDKIMARDSYVATKVEDVIYWNSVKTCCLGFIFLPLALFGRQKGIKCLNTN